jgi:hypothetical protein
MIMKTWLEEFNENVRKEKLNLSEKDIKFFHVERLIKIAEHIETNSNGCADCLRMKTPVLELSANLKRYIHGNYRERTYFERIFDNALKHLKVSHGLYPPFHFNYLYTFIGFFAGIVCGTLIYLLFKGNVEHKLITILALAGLLAGQIAGRRKDNFIRREGRKL